MGDENSQTMGLRFIDPRIELRPFIQSLWLFESPIGMPPVETNFSAPDGRPKLVIPIENSITITAGGQVQPGYERNLYFVGNRDGVTLLQTSRRKTCFIGIEFYPHGAYPIFKLPMAEITNRRMPVDVLLPKWGRDVTEIVQNTVRISDRIDCIQGQLIALLGKHNPESPIVQFCVESLRKSDGHMPVRELERRTGYTQRYLEILFKNQVGLSPKFLARIFRFQRSYRRWAEKRRFDDMKNELYSHYYDQSHFTKEFKRMTGFSPEHFRSQVANEFGRQLALH